MRRVSIEGRRVQVNRRGRGWQELSAARAGAQPVVWARVPGPRSWGSESGAAQLDIDTEGYKRLLHILEVVERDTWQLFTDMHHYNSYAQKKRIEFMEVMQDINSRLGQGDLVD